MKNKPSNKHTCYDPPINRLLPFHNKKTASKSNRCWICGKATNNDLSENVYKCCDTTNSNNGTSMHKVCLDELFAAIPQAGEINPKTGEKPKRLLSLPKNGRFNCKYFHKCNSIAQQYLSAFINSTNENALQLESDSDEDIVDLHEYNINKLKYFENPVHKMDNIREMLAQKRNQMSFYLAEYTKLVQEEHFLFFEYQKLQDLICNDEITRFNLQTMAATKIQKVWRGYSSRKNIERKHAIVSLLQTRIKGYLVRKEFKIKLAQKRAKEKFEKAQKIKQEEERRARLMGVSVKDMKDIDLKQLPGIGMEIKNLENKKFTNKMSKDQIKQQTRELQNNIKRAQLDAENATREKAKTDRRKKMLEQDKKEKQERKLKALEESIKVEEQKKADKLEKIRLAEERVKAKTVEKSQKQVDELKKIENERKRAEEAERNEALRIEVLQKEEARKIELRKEEQNRRRQENASKLFKSKRSNSQSSLNSSNKRVRNASGMESIESDPDNMLDQLDKVHKSENFRKTSGSTTPQHHSIPNCETSSQRSQHSNKSNSNKSASNKSASNKSFLNQSPSNQSFSQKSNKSPHSNHANQNIYRNNSKGSDSSTGEPNNSRPNFSTAPQPPKTKLSQPKSSSAWGQLPPQGQRYQNPNSVQNSNNSNSFNVNAMGSQFPQQPSPYLNDQQMNIPGFMNQGNLQPGNLNPGNLNPGNMNLGNMNQRNMNQINTNQSNMTSDFGPAFNTQAGWGRMPTPHPNINQSANNQNFNDQNSNNQQNNASSRKPDSWGYH